MHDDGDVSSVIKVIQSSEMEAHNNNGKSHEDLANGKSKTLKKTKNAIVEHVFGMKDQSKKEKELMEEMKNLQRRVRDAEKELISSMKSVQTERLKFSRLSKETDEQKREVDRYRVALQTTEAENSQLKYEMKMMSVKIVNLEQHQRLASEMEKMREIIERNTDKTSKLESQVHSNADHSKNLLNAVENTKVEISAKLQQISDKVDEGNEMEPRICQEKQLEVHYQAAQTTETTLRAMFTDISKLTGESVSSEWTEFGGIDWRIYVKRSNDHLSMYLQADKKNDEKWSCTAFFELRLISQKSESIVHVMNRGHKTDVFNRETNIWGYKKFIPFKDLFDDETGYVKDDAIIVAIHVKAFPSNANSVE